MLDKNELVSKIENKIKNVSLIKYEDNRESIINKDKKPP